MNTLPVAVDYIGDGNLYLTAEGDERMLTTVIEVMGEDQVCVSADIPHPEARENCMAEIGERDDITDVVKEKILSHNPGRLFDIDLKSYEKRPAA